METMTPPRVQGLPFLGNMLSFRKDPVELFRQGYEQFGPIFSVSIAGKPGVALIGLEYSRLFLEETDTLFSIREAYPFFKDMFQDDILFLAQEEEHQEQRRIFLKAFQGRKFRKYVLAMAREVNDWLDTLGDEGEFDLVRAFGELTMYVAARAFMGEKFREELGSRYYDLFRDLSLGMEFVIPTHWPLPRFRRRDRAKAELHQMIGAIMTERRAHPEDYDDFLQELINDTYSDGRPLDDELIINMILALTWAGHETTAAQVGWVLVQLLQHPEYTALVEQELADLMREVGVTSQTMVSEMEHLEMALKETERMRTITSLLMRVVKEPLTVGDYEIPAGWLAFICPPVTHYLPELYTNPEQYDPLRFSPERNEQQPFSLLGFGGGPHRCLGTSFAKNEMKVIVSLLMQRYHLELVNPDPQPDRSVVGAMPPEAPCMIRYRRRVQPLGSRGTISAGEPLEAASDGCPYH